jgi:hypothetical protein
MSKVQRPKKRQVKGFGKGDLLRVEDFNTANVLNPQGVILNLQFSSSFFGTPSLFY